MLEALDEPIDRTVHGVMTMITDLRIALRQIVLAPGLCGLATLTFALGAGTNTAVFNYIKALLLRPLPYPESERLLHHQVRRGRFAAIEQAGDIRMVERRENLPLLPFREKPRPAN